MSQWTDEPKKIRTAPCCTSASWNMAVCRTLLTSMLFLHGGHEFHAQSAEFDRIFVDKVNGLRVGVFPGASECERDRIATLAFARQYFLSSYGLQLSEVHPSDLSSVDALILPGGSPVKLLAEVAPHRNEVAALLKRGIIYGASAGAMVLGRGFHYGSAWHPALALADFEVLVHFTAAAVPADRPRVFGLPESGGVVIGTNAEVLHTTRAVL
jgi:peptidase E